MPIFDFECPKCGNNFDSFDNICPKCGTNAIQGISAPNFIIKGPCSNPLNPIEIKEKPHIARKRVLQDYYCPKCNHIEFDLFEFNDAYIKCPSCNSKMKILVSNSACKFELKYNPKKDMFD